MHDFLSANLAYAASRKGSVTLQIEAQEGGWEASVRLAGSPEVSIALHDDVAEAARLALVGAVM